MLSRIGIVVARDGWDGTDARCTLELGVVRMIDRVFVVSTALVDAALPVLTVTRRASVEAENAATRRS
ncbi:hypothetical protein A3C37_00325 [Candidatus Peribacteria bacterium RIFCSPHIGHO2_02_FULL_53_20]|nr:MAG: hypothetical protein A3C37_00325 [Candidatus Peribacteria bacterium RIFCSPHIGHO2_02_FULL_53_20]OGJ66964.1 MAG: hypothetical protein A3B61_03290 [Candidatus Peribacteria bacterium RIFCSPLOWO2_01_FULL_53_10]OGJ71438.1 MAG: hypothetical protein A3G69_04370 [Candidatus Peribacteria bacterium RIFCSPLOWO2_12_FULL_53_10]